MGKWGNRIVYFSLAGLVSVFLVLIGHDLTRPEYNIEVVASGPHKAGDLVIITYTADQFIPITVKHVERWLVCADGDVRVPEPLKTREWRVGLDRVTTVEIQAPFDAPPGICRYIDFVTKNSFILPDMTVKNKPVPILINGG